MLEHLFVNKAERTFFNSLISHAAVMDWVDVFLDRRRRGDRTPVIPVALDTGTSGLNGGDSVADRQREMSLA